MYLQSALPGSRSNINFVYSSIISANVRSFAVPTRSYESLNEQNWMCELRMHVFPNLVT